MVCLVICELSIFNELRISLNIQMTSLICLFYIASGFILRISVKLSFVVFYLFLLVLVLCAAVYITVQKILVSPN